MITLQDSLASLLHPSAAVLALAIQTALLLCDDFLCFHWLQSSVCLPLPGADDTFVRNTAKPLLFLTVARFA